MTDYLWLVPVLPLLGFLILFITQGNLPKPLVAVTGVGSVGLAALLVMFIGLGFLERPEPFQQIMYTWFDVGGLSPRFGLYLDGLSLSMLFVITGVGFLIHVYSAGFMLDDSDYSRFFA